MVYSFFLIVVGEKIWGARAWRIGESVLFQCLHAFLITNGVRYSSNKNRDSSCKSWYSIMINIAEVSISHSANSHFNADTLKNTDKIVNELSFS